MKKIFIDAGHGGDSIGASYKGRFEQDDCLKLALAVGKLLSVQPNITVAYSRTANTNPSITNRSNTANKWKADYFISIHRNAVAPNKANGAEVWLYSKVKSGSDTYNKGKAILDNLCKVTDFKNRGTHLGAPSYTDFGVNRLTNMSSCLLEVGFVDSDVDNKIFDNDFEDMAMGIAKGLCEAVGETYSPLGDLDGDGKVTSADARLALRYATGLELAKENALALGDMDKDGKITSADARIILRKATGLND